MKWWCSATANHEKSFYNLNFSFFNLQFAFCIFEFAVCIFQFAFLDLHFAFYGKGSCQLWQLPSDQSFFLISEISSSIKDKAFSILFSSTKPLIISSIINSSSYFMFCCFIPSTSYVCNQSCLYYDIPSITRVAIKCSQYLYSTI